MSDNALGAPGRGRLRIYAGKYWKLSLAFALYMYYYLTAELISTDLAGVAYGAQAGTVFYGLTCLAGAAGFFAFGLTRPLLSSTGRQRRLLFAAGVVGVCCILLAPYIGSALVGGLLLIALFAAGYIGGAFLCTIAVSVKEKPTLGMFIALPYSLAFLLEFLFGSFEPLLGDALVVVTQAFLAVALATCVILLLVYESSAPADSLPHFERKPGRTKYLWGALVSCLIISCLFGLMDGIIMHLHTGQVLDVWSGVRLLTIPGMLCAAWFADYKDGKFFPFATLLAMVAAVSAVLLWSDAETYNLALGAVYFFFSFMSIYSLQVFVRVASDTDRPGLWAAAGRGIKYAAGGVFALLGSFIFENISFLAIELLYLVLLIILACVFFFQGRLSTVPVAEQPKPTSPDRAQTFREMVAAYGITEREAEVLRFLLKDTKTSDIAAAMFVAQGTVYKYISTMIAKTGKKNRTELVALFAPLKD